MSIFKSRSWNAMRVLVGTIQKTDSFEFWLYRSVLEQHGWYDLKKWWRHRFFWRSQISGIPQSLRTPAPAESGLWCFEAWVACLQQYKSEKAPGTSQPSLWSASSPYCTCSRSMWQDQQSLQVQQRDFLTQQKPTEECLGKGKKASLHPGLNKKYGVQKNRRNHCLEAIWNILKQMHHGHQCKHPHFSYLHLWRNIIYNTLKTQGIACTFLSRWVGMACNSPLIGLHFPPWIYGAVASANLVPMSQLHKAPLLPWIRKQDTTFAGLQR